jgi:hypothetical protein
MHIKLNQVRNNPQKALVIRVSNYSFSFVNFIAFSNIPDMFVLPTYNMFSNLQNIPWKSENQIVQNVLDILNND